MIAIRDEPGRTARCEKGEWVEVADTPVARADLPRNLSITTAGKLATIRYADATQAFQAQVERVAVNRNRDTVLMWNGTFDWAMVGGRTFANGQTTSGNSFRRAELRFGQDGSWEGFRVLE